jgi:2-oxoisovalerate dehydrogenase E1 component beta subunit
VIYFENKFLYRRVKGEVPDGDGVVPLGRARVVREGGEASVIAYGTGVHWALEAADTLQKEDVAVEVVDLRSLVPLDRETVPSSVRKTTRAVVVHEDWKRCGFGAEVAALLAEEAIDHLDGPVVRVASQDTPVPFSPALEKAHLPNAEKVAGAVRRAMRRGEG